MKVGDVTHAWRFLGIIFILSEVLGNGNEA